MKSVKGATKDGCWIRRQSARDRAADGLDGDACATCVPRCSWRSTRRGGGRLRETRGHRLPRRFEPAPRKMIRKSYADNFKYGRIGRWTHCVGRHRQVLGAFGYNWVTRHQTSGPLSQGLSWGRTAALTGVRPSWIFRWVLSSRAGIPSAAKNW